MQPQPVSDVGPVPPVTAVQLQQHQLHKSVITKGQICIVATVYQIMSLTNCLKILSVGEPQA